MPSRGSHKLRSREGHVQLVGEPLYVQASGLHHRPVWWAAGAACRQAACIAGFHLVPWLQGLLAALGSGLLVGATAWFAFNVSSCSMVGSDVCCVWRGLVSVCPMTC